MKIKYGKTLLMLLTVMAGAWHLYAYPQGTAFTYQGRLNDGAGPATGLYDLRFGLYDAASAGGQQGYLLTNSATAVSNGLFTVTLDFGSQFNGADRWLEIGVQTNGGSGFSTLSPRQPLTPTPYAIFAGSASVAASAGSVAAANIAGTLAATQLPTGMVTNNASGVTLSGNFTGDGSGLTNLSAAQLTGTIPLAQLPAGVVTNQGTVNSLSGGFFGSFSGDGGMLSNLRFTSMTGMISLAQLPAAVLTNGGTFTGNVSGNGAALTNIPASAVVAAPPGMVLIPAGAFTMGNSISDSDLPNAATVTVNVSAFYMDVNSVTLSQWQSVYNWATLVGGYTFGGPGLGKAANHPVQTVDWYDCVKWCNARSQQAGRTPVYYTDAELTAVYTNGEVTVYANWTVAGYRLPTEAEWEKAARGGLSGQRFPWGNVINQNLANYIGATGSYSYDLGPNGFNPIGNYPTTFPGTSPVGSFAANGYGLNDMAGNVLEWCWDWYGTPYGQPTTNDPTGPAGPLSYRVLRGGYWGDLANYARCAYRLEFNPSSALNVIGFRCVRGF